MKKAITLILFLFSLFGIAQNEPNDCVNSITVCGNENFVSGASGSGNIQEVAACGGLEHNSLWLKINIAQSGTLGFNLIPSSLAISVDYDFWIYGPNVNCTALGSPIRCCTTNPGLAGLTSNSTGMVGTTLVTQSGPGANGNGFVRWLDVVVGQSYYIAIDRPVGDGGFEIQWTGTAMAGTGAFPIPPTANSISDYKVCSSVTNIGIFDLNTVRSSINNDLVDNEISFYTTFANAFDGANELPNIISNSSNPQTIYAKVKNYTTDCYTITSFNLVVNAIPTATMSVSKTTLCNGESVTVSFSGAANSLIEYTINGGAIQQGTLDSAGAYSFNQTPTSTTVYQFLNIKSLDSANNVICTNIYNTSRTVSVLPLPTASISGTTTICSGSTATITFNGTPNAIVIYTINSGSNQTITLDNTGNASIVDVVFTSTTTYALVDVSYPSLPSCTQTVTGNAIVSVIPNLTATILGTTTICSGSSTIITINGSPNSMVTLTAGSGNFTANLDASGNGSFTTPVLTSNVTYTLISVEMAGTPSCLQPISGSASITISSPPTATIFGNTTICSGNTATITFVGTPNATISYTANSVNQTISLDAFGNATLTTPVLSSTVTYTLVSASFSGTPICSQTISGSVMVTVNPLPSVSISGTTSICHGAQTSITFVGTPNAIVTYSINGGSNLTLTLDNSGFYTLTTPFLTSNSTYNLISVLSNNTSPSCMKNVSGAAIVTVVPIPIVNFTPQTQTICSGQSTFVTLSSNVSTATFSWTVLQSGVSGATASSGSIISQVLTATGPSAGTATYTITPITNGCVGTPNTITITVKPTPTITANPASESICSGGTTAIHLTSTLPGTIFSWTVTQNGVSGASADSGDFISQTLTATSPSSGTATYSITPTLNGCTGNTIYVIVTVSPMPIIAANPSTESLCSGNSTSINLTSTNTTTTYSWTVLQVGVTGATPGNGTSITQALSTTGNLDGTVTYTITPATNGCLGMPIVVIITVKPKPIVNTPASFQICSGESITVPLSSNLAATTFSWTITQTGVTGALNGSGTTISQTLVTTGTAIGTVVYSITPFDGNCTGTPYNYTVTVNPIPSATLTDGIVCTDAAGNSIQNYTFTTGLSNITYDFAWYFQGNLIPSATQNSYTASQSGIYGVIIKHVASGCQSNLITGTIFSSMPGISLSINQSSIFSDNSFVEIIVNGGNGIYLYELDNTTIQTTNIFSNLFSGNHIIKVTDTNGCTNLTKTFSIINYPKFFTPNGDGINDVWYISGLNSTYNAKIAIYDRFGKLVYSFLSPNFGWDGTYNGEKNTATDYWFSIDYKENGQNKVFKSHFSLKR